MEMLNSVVPNPVEDFENWLNSKKDTSIVGNGIDCCNCPVAKWLMDKNKNFKKVRVYSPNGKSIQVSIEDVNYLLPDALDRFVRIVFSRTNLVNPKISKELAQECLNLALGKKNDNAI